MSEERRFGSDRPGTGGPGPPRDELDEVLGAWAAPDVPESLDRRVLASFRRETAIRPIWLRFFTSSVRVPLPVAAATVALLLLSALLALRGPERRMPETSGLEPSTRAADRAEAPVVTHTSLAGFQPAQESGGTVVLEGVVQ